MTNVMRPSGPLPSRVYWTRRGVVLGVLVLVGSLAWWLFTQGSTGGAQGSPTGAAPKTESTSAAPTTPVPSAKASTDPSKHGTPGPEAEEPRDGRGGNDGPDGDGPPHRTGKDGGPRSGSPPASDETEPTELPHPTGDCRPGEVDMEIDVSDSIAGASNTATFILTSRATPACRLAITPDTLVAQVTSGDEVIWSSSDCPDAVSAKQLVVRSDPATAYRFEWNGLRSTDDCQGAGEVPAPGGYWVEAALIGGEPHQAFFDIIERQG